MIVRVAHAAMTEPAATEISLELAAITQSSAYQAIRETKNVSHIETTASNIATVEKTADSDYLRYC